MIYYKELDENFLNYGIKPVDFTNVFHDDNPHELINMPVTDVFTSEGIKFFTDRNIKLRSTTRVLRLVAGHEGVIHLDSEYYDSAFNFIIAGDGTMEWVTMDGVGSYGAYTQSDSGSGSYKRFDGYTTLDIDASWSGKCALVRINTPHRAIGGTSDRYCISVRPTEDHFFDDLVSLI